MMPKEEKTGHGWPRIDEDRAGALTRDPLNFSVRRLCLRRLSGANTIFCYPLQFERFAQLFELPVSLSSAVAFLILPAKD